MVTVVVIIILIFVGFHLHEMSDRKRLRKGLQKSFDKIEHDAKTRSDGREREFGSLGRGQKDNEDARFVRAGVLIQEFHGDDFMNAIDLQEKHFKGAISYDFMASKSPLTKILYGEPAYIEPSFRNELYTIATHWENLRPEYKEIIAQAYFLEKEGAITLKEKHSVYVTLIRISGGKLIYKPEIQAVQQNKRCLPGNGFYKHKDGEYSPENLEVEPLTLEGLDDIMPPLEDVLSITSGHDCPEYPHLKGYSVQDLPIDDEPSPNSLKLTK